MSRKFACLYLAVALLVSSIWIASADERDTVQQEVQYSAAVEALDAAGLTSRSSNVLPSGEGLALALELGLPEEETISLSQLPTEALKTSQAQEDAARRKQADTAAEYAQPVHYADYEGTSATNTVREELIAYAYTYLGTPYVYGGSSYSGTDCSGFTMAVFAKFGYSLSHGASDQYYTATSVSSEERQAGDLVFFDTFGGISHVGIYLGGGQFIHASSSGGVKVNSLYESYYAACYLGAGRILP